MQIEDVPKTEQDISSAKQKLQSWINKHMKIEMTDGRILIGMFLCTDREGNVILGSCSEYLNPEGEIFASRSDALLNNRLHSCFAIINPY